MSSAQQAVVLPPTSHGCHCTVSAADVQLTTTKQHFYCSILLASPTMDYVIQRIQSAVVPAWHAQRYAPAVPHSVVQVQNNALRSASLKAVQQLPCLQMTHNKHTSVWPEVY